ncbi:MAG: DinB family protein [Terracidiphilus sp.]
MRRTSLALSALFFAITLSPAHPARGQANAPQQKTAQQLDLEGVWMGYEGEWHHTTYQLLALAQAIPEKDYAWRPSPGVRSTSEVFMHIVETNYWLLSIAGQPAPPDLKNNAEKTVTSKADVIAWLQRSLEAVRAAHLKETPDHLAKRVHVADRTTTVDGIYLRLIVHADEHMGQLIAYSRMNGVVPPWSAK